MLIHANFGPAEAGICYTTIVGYYSLAFADRAFSAFLTHRTRSLEQYHQT